jgi:hypothetical protein
VSDAIERSNALLDAFYRDTLIWPPGRSAPLEMGNQYADGHVIAHDAFVYWQKATAEREEWRAAALEALALIDSALLRQGSPKRSPLFRAASLLAELTGSRG